MSTPAASEKSGPKHQQHSTAGAETRWARPGLAVLLTVTAVSWVIGLNRNGWANSFYAAAVQAGTKSWKAFLFGSSDAANAITVDKPPASLWPMEISARIFGLNTWSMLLPQVLLGVASVALLYAIVRKQFGPAAGLLAGLVLALAPVATLMFRYNNPDALLVFLMVAAVWALLCAVCDGRTRWLVLCGVLVGLGFLTKQLQVMLIVPGLALTYLIAGPAGIWKRVGQLFAALAGLVVAAGWWVALVEFWPKTDRPYVGGSTDNSFLNLTFGYNGLSRLSSDNSRGPRGASSGITRLFTGESGGQISWLLPAALLFLFAGIVLCGKVARTDGRRAQYLVWGGWLIGTGLTFSLMTGIFHDYYTVALAPAVAALVGIGSVHLWQHRTSGWVAAVLVGTAALTAVWSWVLLGRSADFVPWLRWAVLGLGAAAAVALVLTLLVQPLSRGWVRNGVVAVAVAAALAGPASYSVHTISTGHGGPIVTAGPAVARGGAPLGGLPGGSSPDQADGSRPRDSGGRTGMGGARVGAGMQALLERDAGRYTWTAATSGSNSAAAYQLATGSPVMAIGGFSSRDPAPTLEQFTSYVSAGQIHYYIESTRGAQMGADAAPGGQRTGGRQRPDAQPSPGGGKDGGKDSESSKIQQWVKQNFTATTVDQVTIYDLTTPKR